MLLQDEKLYYVGGVVRDEIIDAKSFDTDFCYEGNAIEFAKNKNLNIIKINPDFGTVRVLVDNKEVDIASTRTENYPKKGHLPNINNIGCSLKEDLIRRDFTINAMAKRTSDGELFDYFGGLKDIKEKKLRILHKDSFIDDPTRIIRGLKFSVRFGFELEAETKQLQDEYLANINYDMSYHRVKKELIETFNLNKSEIYDRFIDQGIFKLLGSGVNQPEIKGEIIKKFVDKYNIQSSWLFYIAPFVFEGFDFNIISPTKAEKRIIEWVNKLKTQEPTHNTPKESIIIREILDNA